MIARRGFLSAASLLLASPLVVRAQSIMPVVAPKLYSGGLVTEQPLISIIGLHYMNGVEQCVVNVCIGKTIDVALMNGTRSIVMSREEVRAAGLSEYSGVAAGTDTYRMMRKMWGDVR